MNSNLIPGTLHLTPIDEFWTKNSNSKNQILRAIVNFGQKLETLWIWKHDKNKLKLVS